MDLRHTTSTSGSGHHNTSSSAGRPMLDPALLLGQSSKITEAAMPGGWGFGCLQFAPNSNPDTAINSLFTEKEKRPFAQLARSHRSIAQERDRPYEEMVKRQLLSAAAQLRSSKTTGSGNDGPVIEPVIPSPPRSARGGAQYQQQQQPTSPRASNSSGKQSPSNGPLPPLLFSSGGGPASASTIANFRPSSLRSAGGPGYSSTPVTSARKPQTAQQQPLAASQRRPQPPDSPMNESLTSLHPTSSRRAATASSGSGGLRGVSNADDTFNPFATTVGTVVNVPSFGANTRYFEERAAAKKTLLGRTLEANSATSLTSPRTIQRYETKKDQLLAVVHANGGNEMPVNIRDFVITCSTRITPENHGALTAATMNSLFAEADLVEPDQSEKLFEIMNPQKDGLIKLDVIFAVCDCIINSDEFKQKTRRACFDLFQSSDYIHLKHLNQMKLVHGDDSLFAGSERTPAMVKALLDVFVDVQRLEEEEYIVNTVLKGKKKKKKKAPALPLHKKSHIPTSRMRKEHIDFATFDRYFATSHELAIAFFPCWVNVMLRDSTLRHACILEAVDVADKRAKPQNMADEEDDDEQQSSANQQGEGTK